MQTEVMGETIATALVAGRLVATARGVADNRIATKDRPLRTIIACILTLASFNGRVGAEELRRLQQLTLAEGQPPRECAAALTGKGGPALWSAVRLPSGDLAVAETSREAVDERFPLCVFQDIQGSDVELSVSFTPIDGKLDQGAGLIFRVMDADNYYVVRANALEGNVNLYHVVQGRRRQFAGGVEPLETGHTRRLGVRIEGDQIQVFVDGRKIFEALDREIKGSGAVGVWTKADSFTGFSDFTATILKD